MNTYNVVKETTKHKIYHMNSVISVCELVFSYLKSNYM